MIIGGVGNEKKRDVSAKSARPRIIALTLFAVQLQAWQKRKGPHNHFTLYRCNLWAAWV